MKNNTVPICEILSRLLFEKKMRTAELARRVKLPQPTVHRIATGTSPKPHYSSLAPLAEFFGITVEQLKGNEPIAWLSQQDTAEINQSAWQKIPLISWESITSWHENSPTVCQTTENFYCDMEISKKSFALRMNDASMSPQFPMGTVLVIDPEKTIKDRNFVVVKLKTMPVPIFRQLLIDGSQQYIKPVSPDLEHFRMTLLDNEDEICGSLAQIKLNFID